jgi:predicted metal-dependent peptidase
MSRPSRRYGTRPGTRKKEKVSVAVIIDTSGSISLDQLYVFLNEVNWIWRNGAHVVIFEADTDVQEKYRFTGKFHGEIHGRGGTNLEVPLDEAEKEGADVIVYFTDFYAPIIEKTYKTPVLWVLSDPPPKEDWPCDWGKAVEIEVD